MIYNKKYETKYDILYCCIDCGTKKYLIFPNGDESLIICSGCYRLRQETDETEQVPEHVKIIIKNKKYNT
tara:strand:- start:314 stop:523 length:210 start_codon:yes stop_codon:yes gene_type:complete